jgi:hypothetical protein
VRGADVAGLWATVHTSCVDEVAITSAPEP